MAESFVQVEASPTFSRNLRTLAKKLSCKLQWPTKFLHDNFAVGIELNRGKQ
jgi:hypothetical protein